MEQIASARASMSSDQWAGTGILTTMPRAESFMRTAKISVRAIAMFRSRKPALQLFLQCRLKKSDGPTEAELWQAV